MVVKLLVALPPLVTLLLLGRPSSALYPPVVLQPTRRQPPSLSKVNYAIEYANPKPYEETTRKSNQDLMDAFWANVELLKSLHSTMKTTAFVPTQKTTTNRPWMTGSLVQYFRSAPSYVVEQPPEAEPPVIENESLIFPAPPSSESLPESRYIIEYANAPEDFATTISPPGRNEQSSQAVSLAVSTVRTRVPSLRSAMFVVVYRDKKKKDGVSAPASKSGNEINITLVATAAAVAERRGNRLPRSVVPQHYRVKLMPFISEGNFSTSGEVWILVRCDSPTQNITLNINDIGILESSVKVTEERRTGFMSRPSNWTGEVRRTFATSSPSYLPCTPPDQMVVVPLRYSWLGHIGCEMERRVHVQALQLDRRDQMVVVPLRYSWLGHIGCEMEKRAHVQALQLDRRGHLGCEMERRAHVQALQLDRRGHLGCEMERRAHVQALQLDSRGEKNFRHLLTFILSLYSPRSNDRSISPLFLLGVMAHVYDTYDQTYKVLLRESLVRGREYTLNIKFLGTLNDLLQGFYRSSYVDHVTGELR
uniref:(California timema) hypothetical protein n=1 Tax=Timema californicum TaxID=61474 RepID=A0A7R9PEX3_TIMCA|nr:unnamed protein product [Timema californicum]